MIMTHTYVYMCTQYSPELEPAVKLLNEIGKAVDAIETKIASIREELEGMEKILK